MNMLFKLCSDYRQHGNGEEKADSEILLLDLQTSSCEALGKCLRA